MLFVPIIGWGAGPSAFTFVGSNSGGDDTSIAINGISPGSIAAGDFCVIANTAYAATGNTIDPTLSGFTKHLNATASVSGNLRGIILRRY